MRVKEFQLDRGFDDYKPTREEMDDAAVDAEIDRRQQVAIEAVKLCKDCKHYVAGSEADYDKCYHPKSTKADPNNFVREVMQKKFYFCSSMRLGLGCDSDAKLWEAKS